MNYKRQFWDRVNYTSVGITRINLEKGILPFNPTTIVAETLNICGFSHNREIILNCAFEEN